PQPRQKFRGAEQENRLIIGPDQFRNAFPSFHHKTLFLFAVFLYLQRFNELTFGFTDHCSGLTAKKYKYFILIILAPLILGGCSGTKYLQPGEQLLKQKIEAPSNISKEALRDLYVQRSNRKLFGIIPYFWFYYTGKKWYDPEKFIRKRAAVEQKFDRKIAALPEESTRKINNLEFKKQRKLSKIDTKIRDGNTVMQWGEPLSILDTTNVRLTAER